MKSGSEFGLTPETIIRDSLYDLVPLSAEASRLLATGPMLRLDGIQQLGFVSRVWPGARHSRFEHSIGVMHLMREAMIKLRNRGVAFDDEAARTGVAAALLHDVGHYPFSHAIEELGDPVQPHEKVARRLIMESEITGLLDAEWSVSPERVADLIDPPEQGVDPRDRIARQLLSGPLDVDKLDYLPRDARACAVPYGGVDTARLIGALVDIELPGGNVLGIDHKGISPMHSLMNARQEMFDNVYWHHTNRACMAMLLRAVQDAIDGGLVPEDLSRYGDVGLLARLAEPDMPESTRRLVAGLRTRQFHKRAIEISSRACDLYEYISGLFRSPPRRRALERRMAEVVSQASGVLLQDGDILIDIPKPEKWPSTLWVHFENPPVGLRETMSWHDVTGIGEAALLTYEHHRRLVRIVATEPIRGKVREHWQQAIYPLLGSV